MMPHNSHFTRIEQSLSALSNPEKARPMAKYMRDQFIFLGIPTPQRREAIKALSLPMLPSEHLFSLVQQLWQQPEREYQYVAIDLLKKNSKQLTLADICTLQDYLQQKSWWDSVDGLASVIGTAMKRLTRAQPRHQDIMDSWLSHDNLWVRRVAMIHQLGWRNNTNEQRLSHYALALATEKEFFIRKAIGWALRDYARHQPDWVKAFVAQHEALLSPLSVREAVKRLS
jgi:3-methyladenine DNA glycosylase AlkD